jgi:hypothetical protein
LRWRSVKLFTRFHSIGAYGINKLAPAAISVLDFWLGCLAQLEKIGILLQGLRVRCHSVGVSEEVLFFLVIFLFVLLVWAGIVLLRSLRNDKTVRWFDSDGQHRFSTQRTFDVALNNARERGVEKQYMSLIVEIRRQYGHQGVRLGHLLWADSMINDDGSICEYSEIPRFHGAK